MIGAQLNKATLARVRFSGEYLWKHGLSIALKNTDAFLARLFGGPLFLQPAEIHLCADAVGLTIPKNYEEVFVSRARVQRPVKVSYLDKPIYRHNKLETLQFKGIQDTPPQLLLLNIPPGDASVRFKLLLSSQAYQTRGIACDALWSCCTNITHCIATMAHGERVTICCLI